MVLFQGCRGKEFSSLPLRPFVKPLFADIGGLVVGTVRYGGTPSGTRPVPHKTPGNIGLARRYGPVRLKSRRRGGKGETFVARLCRTLCRAAIGLPSSDLCPNKVSSSTPFLTLRTQTQDTIEPLGT